MNSTASQQSPAKMTNLFGKISVNDQVLSDTLILGPKNHIVADKDSWVDIQLENGLDEDDRLRVDSGTVTASFAELMSQADIGGLSQSMGNLTGLEKNESAVNYSELYVELESGMLYVSTAERELFRKEILSLSTDQVSIVNAFGAQYTVERNEEGVILSVYKGEISFSLNNEAHTQQINAESSVLITPALDIKKVGYQPSKEAISFFK